MRKAFLVSLSLSFLFSNAGAEDYSFDLSEFEKKPFQWGGFLEAKQLQQSLDNDRLLAALSAPSEDTSTASLELTGDYTLGINRFSAVFHASWEDTDFGEDHDTAFYEAYVSRQQNQQLILDAGKRTLRWGKGYAWSPVAFVERSKDPLDPDLSREGYILATADYITSYSSELKTLAFTPVILPVDDDLNTDYGSTDTNIAAKFYLLYRDIDIDVLYRSEGSRPQRIGVDFSTNLAPNFEIHGEWAHGDVEKKVLQGTTLVTQAKTVNNVLVGMRYLTAQDTTYILEYYHNDEGYSETEMQDFYDYISADTTSLLQAKAVAQAGYTSPQSMRDYLYLRITQKDPFDILYLTAGLTWLHNLQDDSYSLSPELSYTRIDNLELRLRLTFLNGNADSEFGSKVTENKAELRLHYAF